MSKDKHTQRIVLYDKYLKTKFYSQIYKTFTNIDCHRRSLLLLQLQNHHFQHPRLKSH
jgi:hypothetical protein